MAPKPAPTSTCSWKPSTGTMRSSSMTASVGRDDPGAGTATRGSIHAQCCDHHDGTTWTISFDRRCCRPAGRQLQGLSRPAVRLHEELCGPDLQDRVST